MKIKGPVRFIINPVSGIGEKKSLEKIIPEILKESGIEFDIVYTQYAGHATELAKLASKEKIKVLCVIGGDGSVHEAAKALAGSDTILSIIPAGSGNGIARHLGIELNPEKCIREFLNYTILEADTWNLNGHFFLGFAGCGFDAVIAHAFQNIDKRGLKGYMRLIRKEMKRYEPLTLEIITGNGNYTEEIFIASFCNVNQYGNNIIIDSSASVTDGLISLNILNPFPLFQLPQLLYRSYNSRLHRSKYYKKITGKEIVIQTRKPVFIHVDGEPAGMAEGKIKVEKNSEKIFLLGKKDGLGSF